MLRRISVAMVLICAVAGVVVAAEPQTTQQAGVWAKWAVLGQKLQESMTVATDDQPADQKKGAPLPLHTYEGYSGGFITPTAYICNTGPKGSAIGRPSVAYHFLNMGSKYLHAATVTQSFLGRLEVGYAYNYLNLGTLPTDIRTATGGATSGGRNDIHLHHFNLRAMLIEENSFDCTLVPAITGGIHVKYNDGIKEINTKTGRLLKSMGYDKHYGVDYTLTASKTIPNVLLGRPMIVSAGMRFSRAAQNGLLGFGEKTAITFEGNVLYVPTDWLVLGYEIRTKDNPFKSTNSLIGREQNWHAFSATWIVNEHVTVSGVYGLFGTITNANADNSLAVQVKYEF